MNNPRQDLDRGGVAIALAAFGFWGLVPIYYKGLQSVSAWEVLAHRVVWSIPILLVFLAIRDRRRLLAKLRLPFNTVAWLALSALTVSVNWLVFVWAVAHDHVLDTSLGYFITPLINVLLGYLILKERLTVLQTMAVGLAAAGTLYLAWFMGTPPWIALTLAVSFGLYGLLRKRLDVGPMTGLLWETALMFLPAAVYLVWLSGSVEWKFLHYPAAINLLLLGSGLATVLPLIWFNTAAQRLPLSVLGFLQYTAPSISLLIAVFMYGEPFTKGHAVAFTCIWLALVLVTAESLNRSRMRTRG